MTAQFRLDDKVAVITGGARGIGRTTAELFATVGARAVIVDRDGDEARRVGSAIQAAGGKADAHAVDVTNEVAVEKLFAEIAHQAGRLDVLVNNAGASIRKPTLELPREDWDRVVAVNMTAVFVCTKAAVHHMLAAGLAGAIVNIASIMGFSGGSYPNISY